MLSGTPVTQLRDDIYLIDIVARLEALTKELGRPVLVSRAFADAAGMPFVSLGSHPIRGLREVEEVFGIPEAPTRCPGPELAHVNDSEGMQSCFL